jgi:hypothetical protein
MFLIYEFAYRGCDLEDVIGEEGYIENEIF